MNKCYLVLVMRGLHLVYSQIRLGSIHSMKHVSIQPATVEIVLQSPIADTQEFDKSGEN